MTVEAFRRGQRVKKGDKQEFELLEPLGHGAFSTVWLVVDINSGKEWALKISQQGSVQLKRESLLHQNLRHPNIIRLLDWWQDSHGNGYLLQEWAPGGELFERIQPDQGFPLDAAHMHFLQLLRVLIHLHERGVAHRDVKAENLLLDANGNLKLTDFGLATLYRRAGEERPLHSRCGTELYMAPEVFAGKAYRGESADVWSLGVVLYLLVQGAYPWEFAADQDRAYREYLRARRLSGKLSEPLQSLLISILDPNPDTRPTLKQIFEHPWVKRENPLLNPADGQCAKPLVLASLLNAPLMISVPEERNDEVDEEDLFALTQPELVSVPAAPTGLSVPRFFSQPASALISSPPQKIDDWLSNRLTRFECNKPMSSIVEAILESLNAGLITSRHEGSTVKQSFDYLDLLSLC